MATINGTNGSNIIVGTNAGDVINAGGGNDIVLGGNGNDTLNGGDGTDLISGGNGNDTLNGGAGSDIVLGGAGNDTLIRRVADGAAYDLYDGGNGTDTLRLVVSDAVFHSAAFQSDLAQLQAKLAQGSATDYLDSINLQVTSIERLEVIVEGNANHAPTDIALTANTVAENAAGAVIGTLSTVDPDAGNTHTYAVSDSRFEVVGNSLKLRAGESLNFENGSQVIVSITTKDGGNLSFTEAFTINVTNVNEAPTDIALTGNTVAENTSVATTIGTLSTVDPDAGNTHTYTVSDQRFEVVGNTLKLKAGQSLDFETEPSINVNVTSTDAGGLPVVKSFIVNVTNVNEVPVAGNDTRAAVEDVPLTISAASLLANDSDPDGNPLTIAGFGNAQNGTVTFDGTNFTFVPADDFAGVASFQYTAQDANGAQSTATVTVNVAADADDLAITPTPAAGAADDAFIALDIEVVLNDLDGSETIQSIEIQGVPDSYVLSAGAPMGDGGWRLAPAELAGLKLIPVDPTGGASGVFELQIIATSVDGSDTNITSASLAVSIAPPENAVSGRVIEGYIAGATVFADTDNDGFLDREDINQNGILDAGEDADGDGILGQEAFATTAADGTFTLIGGSGPLVTKGGRDVSTGLDFLGVLKAPEGSTVVTPLTTLVAELSATLGIAGAEAAVAAAFGLDENIDLKSFDPVPGALAGNPEATAVLSASVQVYSTIAQIEAAGGSAEDAVAAIAGVIGETSGVVNLGDAAVIGTIVADLDFSEAAGAAVASVVAAANVSIQSATDATEIAQAAVVAQGETAEALANTNFGNPAEVQSLTDTYADPVILSDKVENAEVGDVDGALVGTIGNDTLTGDFGGVPANDTIDGLDGNDTISGLAGNDVLYGGAGIDRLIGGGGDDLLDGGTGRDRAEFADATGGIAVNLALGTVTGLGVGSDTLRSIEHVGGSDFVDTFVATGFSGTSANAGSNGAINLFEGRGGDDLITGNGNTQVSYRNATAAVTVNIAMGQASGDASVGTDSFSGVNSVTGSDFGDDLTGGNAGDQFNGGAGDDNITGGGGVDSARYFAFVNDTVTGGVTINMAAGTVTGDASVGSDTLLSIENIRGSSFADSYTATGFSGSSANAGSNGTFNEFEGMGGNDSVVGNGNTRLLFAQATAGVTVDIAAGTASGNASVGNDTISTTVVAGFVGGVNGVTGSQFGDTLLGSGNANQTTVVFDGRGGDDTIDGRGGFDQAVYHSDAAVAAGISVAVSGAGLNWTVTGDNAVGTDTLISVESIRGTNFADTFVATGFNGASTDTIANGSDFNEFEGMAGNDTITGNGNTRLSYANAGGFVTVDLAAGTATGNLSVGTDTITGGVARVRGSGGNDFISGDANNNNLEGQNGNDRLDGRGGNDLLTGGANADTFVYANGYGADTITDFNRGQGDKIDLTGASGIFSLADVQAIASLSAGTNTFINFGGGNTLLLSNVTPNTLVETDFIFAAAPNPAPTDIGLSGTTIAENSANGTVVGSLSATDPGDTATFTLLNNAGGRFAISGNDIVVNGALDFETGTSHAVTVRVTDSANNTHDETFTIDVNDVNEAPTAVSFANTTPAIDENVAVGGGIKVADIVVTDDALGAETLTLSGADAASFAIVGNELRYIGSSPDFEAQSSYSVTVNADDASLGGLGSVEASQTFTLTVNDVNEAPTAVSFNNTTTAIDENATVGAGIKVADIGVTDDALGTETLTLSGADAASFAIVGNELHYIGSSPDFEAQSSYSVTVNADDTSLGGLGSVEASQTFTLTVNDVNEAPTAVSFNNTTTAIDENATVGAGIKVADIAVTDDGLGTETLTLSGADAASFAIVGNELHYIGSSPDFEAQSSYSVTVNADDASLGGPVDASQTFTLNVNDVNEAPTAVSFNNTTTAIDENVAVGGGIKVADILVTDDALGTETLTLSGADASSFAIVGNELHYVGSSPDFETKSSYSVTVNADDASLGAPGSIEASQSFTLNINDIAGLTLTGDANANTLIGSPEVDTLSGLDGADILVGGAGADTLNGGAAQDFASYETSSSGLTADLLTTANNTGDAAGDTYISIERLRGSDFNDVLRGDNVNNFLEGGLGADTLDGRGGSDYASYILAGAAVTASLANQGLNTGEAAGDTYTSIEGLVGSDFDDTLLGNANNNFFRGNGGADVIDGGGGTDTAEYTGATTGVTADLANSANNTNDAFGDTYISIENLRGSNNGADTLRGDAVQNFLEGGNGNFADVLDGGDNNDFASYSSAASGLTASLANSGINTGDAQGDIYISIEALQGSNFDDTLIGDDNNNFLLGGLGADVLDGGLGIDSAEYRFASSGLTVDLSNSLNNTGEAVGDTFISIENLRGSGFNDTLTGDNNDNFLRGQGGADVLNGGGGSDTADYFSAGSGIQVDLQTPANNNGDAFGDTFNSIENLRGGAFNDNLRGNGSNNTLIGGDGNDTLRGRGGADVLDGGTGNDTADYSNAGTAVIASLAAPGSNAGEAAGDTYISIERLRGTGLNDTLIGDGNNNFLEGGAGADTLDGGGGDNDFAWYNNAAGVTANLANSLANSGDAAGDVYIGIRSLAGSNVNDTLIGDGSNNYLRGQGGADALDGGAGNDTADYLNALDGLTVDLANAGNNSGDAAGDAFTSIEFVRGSDFNDVLRGDSNNNQLDGAGGADVLDGGDGLDYAWYNSAEVGLTASLADPGSNTGDAAGDSYISIEGLIGTAFDDVLIGDAGDNYFRGNGGSDIFNGGDGHDVVSHIRFTATEGVTADLSNSSNNTGDAQGDTYISIEGLEGSNFGDTLTGDSNANTLDGAGGADVLTGGGGDDTFKFTSGQAAGDTIADFIGNGGSAGDMLEFRGFGTAAQGATFTDLGGGQWQIHSGLDGHDEVITIVGAVNTQDYLFLV